MSRVSAPWEDDLLEGWRATARAMMAALGSPNGSTAEVPAMWRPFAAGWEVAAHCVPSHARPAFGIDAVEIDGRRVAVEETVRRTTPFVDLLHFAKAEGAAGPRVLVVAPLSGHFATLLRDTVATLLIDHDVFLTDWRNARDVPVGEGAFGVDDQIDTVIDFLREIGPGVHVVAVCQPCVEVVAAVALMAEDDDPATPRSTTLIAGPIDTRISPTRVDELARRHPIEWFEQTLVETVPDGLAGAGRRVYPGRLQIGAFMAMNPARHLGAQIGLWRDLAVGDFDRAGATRRFYDDYLAVLDLPAEFYLETIARVFQEHRLAEGRFDHRGRRVDPAAIRRTALLTVEGERDDVCGRGQTAAAAALLTSLPAARKRHHLQAGVGHYGVFSGRHWRDEVAPLVAATIAAAD
jgi:polyhydroxyalkanoate depolymerase